jgi:hypothetical protein
MSERQDERKPSSLAQLMAVPHPIALDGGQRCLDLDRFRRKIRMAGLCLLRLLRGVQEQHNTV